MRGIGFPLYVNGQLYQEPVTISHTPGPSDAQGVLGGMGIDPSMGGLGNYALYRPTRGMPRGYGDDAPAQAPIDPESQPPAAAAAPIVGAPPGASITPAPPVSPVDSLSPGLKFIAATIDILSMSGLAYHGYKRNNSLGWSIVWAVFGGAFPIIAWPVALAQGFGEPKRMTANRSRRHRRNGYRRRRRSRR